jgi:D-3-phosphoglycerate dehydrogenase
MELIDVESAAARNIKCVSSPEGNRIAVAEHTLGLLLSIEQNIRKSADEVREFKWLREPNRGTEISGKTIGIVGFGNTGEALSKLLSGFKTTVLAYDKYRFGFAKGLVKEANLEQIARYADVISFHVPLTGETRHMANADFFNSLQKQPVILNTSRGEVVDTAALIEALDSEKVSGAGLDVLENESPASFNEAERQQLYHLSNHPRVIVTPHIAGYTHEAFLKMSEVLLKKLKL